MWWCTTCYLKRGSGMWNWVRSRSDCGGIKRDVEQVKCGAMSLV